MINFGIVKPGVTLRIPFDTFAATTGAPTALSNFAVGDILVYKDGSTTERASTTGYTATTTFDSLTGINEAVIDLSSDATADFFKAGSNYVVVISPVTADGQTLSFVAATFSIGHPDAVLNTSIATLSSQTSFTLTAGPAEDDALNGMWAIVFDKASAVQWTWVQILDYTGASKTVTLAATPPATFTIAAIDNFCVMAVMPLQPTVTGRQPVVDGAGLVDATAVKLGPSGSGTAQTAKDVGGAVPAVAAGAANGLLIAGANAATTFATLTVTGAMTFTGNVVYSDGITVSAPSTGNRSGITVTGNGTGHGISLISGSGATGNGLNSAANSTDGNGISLVGKGGGHGVLTTGGLTGDGGKFAGGGTTGHGITTTATGINRFGLNITAGTGHAANFTAGVGAGSDAIALAGTDAGISIIAAGGSGIVINGATHGIEIDGASGDGLHLTSSGGNGNGILATGQGTGNGVLATGGTGANGDGFEAVAGGGAGGVPIRGNITGNVTGNVSGSVGSVTAGVTLAAAAVQAIWDALTTVLTTVGSIGKLLVTNVDALISSRTKPADTQARVTLVDTLTTYTGNTVQTGDCYPLVSNLKVKKNTALAKFPFLMVLSADHITPATGLTVVVQRSINGAAFANATNTPATEIANGVYYIDLSAADLNGDTIVLKMTSATADQRTIVIATEP